MELFYTKQFLKSAQKLPARQQEKIAKLLEILRLQPFSPLLHAKPLVGQLTGFYSFRINREYRATF